MKRALGSIASLLVLTGSAFAQSAEFPECAPPTASTYVVGALACQLVDSAHLGAQSPFGYYVPPSCVPTAEDPDRRCPVVVFFHGTGGSYAGLLGQTFVKALTHRPPKNPLTAASPWTMQPDTWIPAEELPMILVAPHNRTLQGGFGPAPGMDGLWSDWNPRYAKGGDSPQYATPPPRFESFIIEELLPFLESFLPVGASRGWRGTVGHSQGGFGALKIPLQHPDTFAAAGSMSGGSLPFGRFVNVPNLGIGLQPPAPVPLLRLPGITPLFDYPPETNYLVIPSLMPGYGDPVADGVNYEAEFPSGIAGNGRAWQDGRQAIAFRLTVGDAIPRRLEDITDNPQGYASSQGYEILTNVATREMKRALDLEGLDSEFLQKPGLHGGFYQTPYYRLMLEFLWRNLKHPDGSSDEVSAPDTFDFKSIRREFDVWGWSFTVEREPLEFLNLTDVSCDGLTLRGTGVVHVTVPAACGTGVSGAPTFTVDLGPAQATDEPLFVGALPIYGKTVTVALAPL